MGILDSLAMGLRGAGAIFSEDVFKRQGQEEQIAQQLQNQQRTLMAQQVIKGAESGAIPPDVAKQTLGKLFPGMEVPVGPDAQTQQRQAEIQRRDAISKGFASLAPEDRGNPLKIAEVFMQNGDHERGAQYINAAETRQARQEALIASLEQRRMEAERRSEDAAQNREARAEAARQANALRATIAQGQQAIQRDSLELRRVMGSMRQEPAPTVTEIADPKDPTKSVKIDARTGRVIGAAPPKSETDKPLTEAQAKGSLFYSQMVGANREINGLIGFDVNSLSNQIGVRAANRDMTNWLAPEKAQQYNQAAQQWAEAYLRLKTGAAATEGEVKGNARTFFPQPGDSVSVINQKNRMRAAAEADVGMVAGPGKKQVDARRSASAPAVAGSVREQADAILGGR